MNNKLIFSLVFGIVLLIGILGSVSGIYESTLDNELVGYWTFDETSGTDVADSVGVGEYGGTLYNGTATSWRSGDFCKINGCIDLYTTSDFVSIGTGIYDGYDDWNDYGNDFSISFWGKSPAPATNNDGWIAKSTLSGGVHNEYGQWGFSGGDTSFIIWLNQSSTQYRNSGGTNPNTWDMYTITYNQTHLKQYINGALNYTEPLTTNIIEEDSAITVGTYFSLNENANITMDELGYWNRSLTYDEIISLYASGSGLPYIGATPLVTLQIPEDNSIRLDVDINLTSNYSKSNSGTTLVNSTLEVWHTNGTVLLKDTYSITGETNTSSWIKTIPIGNYYWNTLVFDDVSSAYAGSNYSVNVSAYSITNFYNSNTYETSTENFIANLSTNGTYTTSAQLFYDGVGQGTATKTGNDLTANFSDTVQIPTGTGAKEIIWQITIGNNKYNTSAVTQTVNAILFGLCNATLTQPYINFTFKDEETLDDLNVSIDSSTWEYWLGDGTYTKDLLFSNNTDNYYYAFCLLPGNVTLKNTRSIQYSKDGYPQRKYDASSSLTNTTTNKTLYLLSSADGIYSTIQVVDSESNSLVNTEVTAERQFSGIWTVVGQETTDASGAVTFWLNPDYDHRFTFVKSGCTGTTTTIRPTQTQYTQVLSCGASAIYVEAIEGIMYFRTPPGGILQPGETNFSYRIISTNENIINVTFQLVNASNNYLLAETSSACSPGGCTISLLYTITAGDNIKGRYYVDVGGGLILLEGDAWWKCIDIPTQGKSGVSTFFRDMMYVFQEWGDDTSTNDFNKLVIIFFLLCVFFSYLNYKFDIDSMNPGAFLVGFTLIVFLGSIIGGRSPGINNQGLFYFTNLTGAGFINNYILLFICMMITTSYFIGVNRRNQ